MKGKREERREVVGLSQCIDQKHVDSRLDNSHNTPVHRHGPLADVTYFSFPVARALHFCIFILPLSSPSFTLSSLSILDAVTQLFIEDGRRQVFKEDFLYIIYWI
jgi:hypothetical protein